MIKKIRLKQRLILPIALLGIVALLSNLISILNIHNVNASASTIADNYMDGKSRLAEICQASMNIHKMALSHIVATDYNTMITLIGQIKEEEAVLDGMLAEYEPYVLPKDRAQYESLLTDYASFRQALIRLACASASHKTQDAYTLANGDVAACAEAMETDIDALNASISEQTRQARSHLSAVYLISVIIGAAAAAACILLVFADVKLITGYVVIPIQSILKTIRESSGRINHMTGEVLERTQASKGSAAGLSSLSGQLSSTIRKVARNISDIHQNAETVRNDVRTIADECSAITDYTVQMNARAEHMQQSAQNSAETTGAKAEEILRSLDDAIEKSKSVDRIQSLASEILAISQQTRLISLNASVEAVNAGDAGKGFAVVADEVRGLAQSSQDAANRIQEINGVVTAAVYNLAEHARQLTSYMSESVLTEFESFVQSGSQYKEDAAYIRNAMDEFNERTTRLKTSMSEIADSIHTITTAIDEGANGISGVAGNTKSLANDMEDIAKRMGVNLEVVEGLEKETVAFDNL